MLSSTRMVCSLTIKPIFKSGDKSSIKNYRPMYIVVMYSIEGLGKNGVKKIIDFVSQFSNLAI